MGDGGPQPIGLSFYTMLEMGIGHNSTKKKKKKIQNSKIIYLVFSVFW
jgi:hypothetical protein